MKPATGGMGDDVAQLSLPSLRVELHRRGLLATGLKPQLQARLLASLQTGSPTISVPNSFNLPASPSAPPKRKREDVSAPKPEKKVCVDTPHPPDPPSATGVVVGRSVWVTGTSAMASVWRVDDAYGKGNLSRSAPTYAHATDEASTKGKAARQLIALERAEENASARDGAEHLQLTLVEAFHAAFVAGRLTLSTMEGTSLNEGDAWDLFARKLPRFRELFAAYARYRSTGWMARSGLKYGVDWVLYRLGQRAHAHAPYCVVIRFGGDGEEKRLESSWIRTQNKLRLVKNVAKSLVITEVGFEDGFVPTSWREAVETVSIMETTCDRWTT